MDRKNIYNFSDTNLNYYNSIHNLVKNGERSSPRGLGVLEIRPCLFMFNSYQPINTMYGRKPNIVASLAEVVWILAGRGDFEWMRLFNANLANFLDDWGNGEFNAPYGHRIRKHNYNPAYESVHKFHGDDIVHIDQIQYILKKFEQDIHTRQAVITLWNPIFDTSDVPSKDYPCNDMIFFKVRNNKLDMTVFNRSNDIHWGLFGVNVYQFSFLHRMIKDILSVELGVYYHYTDSLHYYVDNPITENMKKYNFMCFNIYSFEKAISNKFVFDSFKSGDWEKYDYITRLELIDNDLDFLINFIMELDGVSFNEDDIASNSHKINSIMLKDLYYVLSSYLLLKFERYEEVLKILKLVSYSTYNFIIPYLNFIYRKSGRNVKVLHKIRDFLNVSDNDSVMNYINNG